MRGEAYASENESFGLATVRRDHVTVRRNEVVFDFPAKSGQRRAACLCFSLGISCGYRFASRRNGEQGSMGMQRKER